MLITQNHENVIITALGAPVAWILIDRINAQNQGGNTGPAIPFLVNNTQSIYTADANYTETIDDVVVTHLTI